MGWLLDGMHWVGRWMNGLLDGGMSGYVRWCTGGWMGDWIEKLVGDLVGRWVDKQVGGWCVGSRAMTLASLARGTLCVMPPLPDR